MKATTPIEVACGTGGSCILGDRLSPRTLGDRVSVVQVLKALFSTEDRYELKGVAGPKRIASSCNVFLTESPADNVG